MTDTPAPRHAQIDWDEQGRPHSRQYDDIYFSKDQSLAETEHVFIEQNDLRERLKALAPGSGLTIGETGFGTGLNFFCAWQLFEQHAPADSRLHFISAEKFPLSRDDLGRALALWPELTTFSEPLLQQYVAVHEGYQHFLFDNGRVSLTLLIGDASEQFGKLDGQVDAWFLDGFAPAKNPDMWTPELFAQVGRLSVPGTTLGTFTSTGWVRRALIAVGFKMKRIPGIGKKWEVLRGRFEGWPEDQPAPAPVAPWYRRPPALSGPQQALVIGAGLAGCASAASLAARGWQVELLERHAGPAQEASGNPQGVLYLKLSAHGTVLSQLIVSGFGHTRRLLERLQRGTDWDDCGVLQLAFDDKEDQRQAVLAGAFDDELLQRLDRQHAEAVAGVALASGGLFYPEGGWVHPPALCHWQSAQPNVRLLTHHDVLQLRKVDGLWQAWDGERLLASAPVVVLAGAADIQRFEGCAGLPLKRIRGQITRLPVTAASQALNTVVCADGYVAPSRHGEHTLGASFDFHSTDLTPTAEEHHSNLELLREISADLAERLDIEHQDPQRLEGRAAFRCTTPDYLPLVGPVADAPRFAATYAALAKNARQVPEADCPWLEGLYVNSGHGSRGLITAPLCGELVAAWINGDALPVPRELAEACHPNRFMLRELKRGSGR
ncbi:MULTISPECIES: bifunctional tRNA (5-methylaminomethyl-2-thiouridine)(34)-methyltransferase MnmD/FAD-dependent 5-carboxymethylaminomethyl-2-thiouridine(34) oxidoreductase MnmC [unclassified Pseudomonas]|uniref:bifunctional tRNA (5-methylaminomethyl-2-thiouridine)(34)-methyltransferase MnmD/FAD-dependent 5-carboxymethylaminomethyl-2-thiouridine(34) oxidoreductase MnmC n=1 Tax=unclassified Pseudomonas TaxID=196821 RepID=UPI0021C79EBA|nr:MULTISPECIES: bifunctional tRNA (5-methylaminomethyl-2-thiouridine)(34)-methyltransferase MnmD/FAD-dependent 5-carboxymethylaminomethyl-2-thiouridine(34) oxidoreductase MnmC [unclassified Pseudomonas]MCU1734022.1 bifunctional tRNA (5-methylaminomethyl-2-thiouridine)(34)-methyltransferase MnmD/FAD-dependent 5-carboxymethylaminomethyl-2-thiouridine(34) oxidoreductase MnmC [Pseudomonas sp. 20P_3.2_Bac4]MCU1742310.1 bifunctional tRNA (5-methylaminomethyl-2-thiouridine)(34)-methyltransferase MnmD/F